MEVTSAVLQLAVLLHPQAETDAQHALVLADEESLGGCTQTGIWEVPPFNCLPFLGGIVLN